MAYIGVPPFGQTVRSVTSATATAGQTTFSITGGYVLGYVDVFLNGVLLAPSDYTASDGLTVVLNSAAALNDQFEALSYQTISFTEALQASNNLSDVANVTTARSNLGLGTAATQNSTAFASTGKAIAMAIVFGG